MKNYILVSFISLCFAACNTDVKMGGQPEERKKDIEIPSAGTIILADSMRIPDQLNELFYSVKIVANEYTRQGTYDIKVLYGHNNAETQITFPRGGSKKVIPVMKRSNEPFAYIIGFHYGEDDSTFYEYYLVKGAQGRIEMKYLKAYSFQ